MSADDDPPMEIRAIAREADETDAAFRARVVEFAGESGGQILDQALAPRTNPLQRAMDEAIADRVQRGILQRRSEVDMEPTGEPATAASFQQMLGRLDRSTLPDAERCPLHPPGFTRCPRPVGHDGPCSHREMISYPMDPYRYTLADLPPPPDVDALLRSYGEWAPPVDGAALERLALDYAGLRRTAGESDQSLRRRILGNVRQAGKRANFGSPGGMMAAVRLQREERQIRCNYHDWAKDSASSRGGKIRLRGLRLGRGQLGELSARYAIGRRPGIPNRHAAARWLRHTFAPACAVANDALQDGCRDAAVQVLLEVVCLQDAVRLTAESFRPVLSRRPRKLADYVNIEITAEIVAPRASFGSPAILIGDAVSVDQDGRVCAAGDGPAAVIGVVERVNANGTVGIRLT